MQILRPEEISSVLLPVCSTTKGIKRGIFFSFFLPRKFEVSKLPLFRGVVLQMDTSHTNLDKNHPFPLPKKSQEKHIEMLSQ